MFTDAGKAPQDRYLSVTTDAKDEFGVMLSPPLSSLPSLWGSLLIGDVTGAPATQDASHARLRCGCMDRCRRTQKHAA